MSIVSDVDIRDMAAHNGSEVRSLSFVESHCERPFFVRESGMWVRCGSGDPSVCRKCASLRSLDKKRIIGSGCNPSDLDGITWEMLRAYRFFFVTFTAPSFGKIVDGVPRDPRHYQYGDQVSWNQLSPKLFHASMVALERSLPGVEWVFVREWQCRGAIHFHGIVRVPRSYASGGVWSSLRALRSVTSHGISWGRQMDIQYVDGDTSDTVRYMSKIVAYTSKHQGGDRGALPESVAGFYARLDRAARKLTCNRKGCSGDGRCGGRLHRTHGYAGYMLSKSKNWSFADLTFGRLREQRAAFAASQRSNTINQDELAEAARLAQEAYDAAFADVTPEDVVAGGARLRRALAAVGGVLPLDFGTG